MADNPDRSRSRVRSVLAGLCGLALRHGGELLAAAILAVQFFFLLDYFDLTYILLDTTPTGGDTPAHNYLATHLRETILAHGSIIGWAKGWWCGFPMYQYYFPLPYAVMAMLSLLIPMNIAFKIVSISGVLFLPLGVYFSLRWLKFDEPIPLISAIAMTPFLFVDSHTMWGVNIYSTLAGEISNSISFVFFVLFVGSFYSDMKEARFRLRTVVLLTLIFYSHFFTSVIACFGSLLIFLVFCTDHFRKRAVVYCKTGGLTFLMVAWWLIPLMAKRSYSMEFGGDWDVVLWKTFPHFLLWLLPFVVWALLWGIVKKEKNCISILLLLLLSIVAFFVGGKINSSFTNIRFWPFIFFFLLVLASIGAGYIARIVRGREILVVVLFVLSLMAASSTGNDVSEWAKWNYEGLENKADYPFFESLVLPLDNTPGRLANDLHADNNRLGSTRVFETVPALINKDILEGGIVNSATGSMLSYYIQCETSDSCAGFPTVVNPTTFDIERATAHLKLANVSHFIAYSERTRKAMLDHPDWKLLKTAGPYQLFELTSNDGRYVEVLEHIPLAVKTENWKESAMEWLYTIEAIDTPVILLYEGMEEKPDEVSAVLREEEYLSHLDGLSRNGGEISLWLTLGPFYFPAGLADEEAADLEMVDISLLKPEAGRGQFGHTWRPILREGPIFLDGLYQPKYNFISYNYANIRSEEGQRVLLHYSNDDHARIYLNGELIQKASFTGLNNYKTVEIALKRGNNPLLYKLEQSVGGVYFHAKITDLDNKPLDTIDYSIFPGTPDFECRKLEKLSSPVLQEEEFADRTIRFKTGALHRPHLIKCSYFPNWKVEGAETVYHVTPNFMLVYPEREEVTLYYGSLLSDTSGRLLTCLGSIIFLGILIMHITKGKAKNEDKGTQAN
jgi:hypothetical protein